MSFTGSTPQSDIELDTSSSIGRENSGITRAIGF